MEGREPEGWLPLHRSYQSSTQEAWQPEHLVVTRA